MLKNHCNSTQSRANICLYAQHIALLVCIFKEKKFEFRGKFREVGRWPEMTISDHPS